MHSVLIAIVLAIAQKLDLLKWCGLGVFKLI